MPDKNSVGRSVPGHRKQQPDAGENGVPFSDRHFTTVSDLTIKPIYTPDDVKEIDFARDIGFPGEYPFTRGCQPTGYRGRIWTFRMFSGFGTARDTNKRWHQLLKDGETGLSTAFDFPTLMGYDSDSPRAHAEVGKCGVAIDTLAGHGNPDARYPAR